MDDERVISFIPYGSRLGFHEGGVVSTITHIDYKFPQCVCWQQNQRNEVRLMGDKTGSICAQSGIHNQNYLIVLNDQGGAVMDISNEVTATLRAQDHGHPPVVCFAPETNNCSSFREDTVSATLTTSYHYGSGGDAAMMVICLEGNGARPSHKGSGISEDGRMFTLNTIERHAVCYGICSLDSNAMKSSNPHSGFYEAKTSRTLDLNGGNPACNQGGVVVVIENAPDVLVFKERAGCPGGVAKES